MALTLAKGHELATTPAFQNRVALAFYYIARDVVTEDPTTQGHPLRLAFARTVLQTEIIEFGRFAAMVITDPLIVSGGSDTTTQDEITDSVIISKVEGMWNALANVGT